MEQAGQDAWGTWGTWGTNMVERMPRGLLPYNNVAFGAARGKGRRFKAGGCAPISVYLHGKTGVQVFAGGAMKSRVWLLGWWWWWVCGTCTCIGMGWSMARAHSPHC